MNRIGKLCLAWKNDHEYPCVHTVHVGYSGQEDFCECTGLGSWIFRAKPKFVESDNHGMPRFKRA